MAEPVPLFGVQRQAARLRPRLDARLAAVLDHGRFILGPEVEALEARLAEWAGGAAAGVAGAVGVGSGWDALHIALAAEGVGPGDAVFAPAFTFSATADAVVARGAEPVFVDVDPETCNLSPAALEAAVAAVLAEGRLRVRAVIPVDLFGLPADYAGVCDALHAAPEPVFILADAAQSFGGEAGGRQVGALAPVTAFSFYPTKPLGAFGDGGAILADTEDRLARYRSIRNCGRGPDGLQHAETGPTARLDTLQAAILLEKLDAFPEELARRRAIAARYDAALAGRAAAPVGEGSAWALYTLQAEDRDGLRARLSEAGIGSAVYYSRPLPEHPVYRRFAPPWPLPVSQRLSRSVLSIPIHGELTDAEVDRVCAVLDTAL